MVLGNASFGDGLAGPPLSLIDLLYYEIDFQQLETSSEILDFEAIRES